MHRTSIPWLLTLGLIATPGCFTKSNGSTENPDGAAADAADGAEAPAQPSRAASMGSSERLSRAGGRIKSFDSPKDVRTEMVLALPPESGVELTVMEARPSMAAVGSFVEIFGSGFGAQAADNAVSTNGVAWEVVEVYGDRLVAKVPEGAGAGPIQVKTGVATVESTNGFTALQGDDAFERPSGGLHGLVGQVYKVEAAQEGMPDFESASAMGTIALDTFDIGTTAASDFDQGLSDYAIRFTGSLNVTGEGEYDLCLASDDGSRLLLMDTLVIDNGGVHESAEMCELVYLEAGEYDIAIEYQNSASTPSVALNFTWAKDGGDKAPVPSDALYRP